MINDVKGIEMSENTENLAEYNEQNGTDFESWNEVKAEEAQDNEDWKEKFDPMHNK